MGPAGPVPSRQARARALAELRDHGRRPPEAPDLVADAEPGQPHRHQRAGRLPNGELEVVQGGGHMPWYDDLGRVGAPVARFLGS